VNYLIGISYVGGPDYLKKALASIGKKHLPFTCVINSTEPFGLQWKQDDPWHEIVAPVALSHTQTHNYLQALAYGLDALFVMHNDCEAEPDTIDKLLESIDTLDKKWGVVFTQYDALAAYNPNMFAEVGTWDWRLFPSYYSDNDYYRRVILAGWTLHESRLPVAHEGSHIINKVNKQLKFLNHTLLADAARNNYIAKWGGPPGEERYAKPFNGLLENPYPDS
jgi:GT2 family glycosyltransferase